jgi:hypothetical protein
LGGLPTSLAVGKTAGGEEEGVRAEAGEERTRRQESLGEEGRVEHTDKSHPTLKLGPRGNSAWDIGHTSRKIMYIFSHFKDIFCLCASFIHGLKMFLRSNSIRNIYKHGIQCNTTIILCRFST